MVQLFFWLNSKLRSFQKCFSYITATVHIIHVFWVSPVLGWGSEVSCPRTLPRKNPEDPVWLKPRTPGLRVKHFTTEPRSTPTKRQNLTLVQIQSNCRWQNKCDKKFKFVFGIVKKKNWENRRKCRLPKAFFIRIVKSWDCVVKT